MSETAQAAGDKPPKRETKKEKLRQELLAIHDSNDTGLLLVDDVVEFARVHIDSALHNEFEWDTGKAAIEHWRAQARQLIQVHVVVLKPESEPVRCWVSLESDRVHKGGGYRTTATVMTDAQRREQLVRQAMGEVHKWQKKYAHLKELAEIFTAIDTAAEEAG